jgi:hypothetical protein
MMGYPWFLIWSGFYYIAGRRNAPPHKRRTVSYTFMKSISYLIIFVFISLVSCQSESNQVSNSPEILEANLVVDLSSLKLVIRSDSTCTVTANTWLSVEHFHGLCEIDKNKIIFHKRPYDNDFIPDTATIIGNKIALRKDFEGNPDTTSFASYFSIVHKKE